MKERPIIFSGPMVRAILAGQKTQTRRVVKVRDQRDHAVGEGFSWRPGPTRDQWWTFKPCDERQCLQGNGDPIPEYATRCPYGAPGDRLWVRETWAVEELGEPEADVVVYRADGQCRTWGRLYRPGDAEPDQPRLYDSLPWGLRDLESAQPNVRWIKRWRPSIHMPRWASRLTLEVTAVRVERVQEISMADCAAEGIPCPDLGDANEDPRPDFAALWDSINAKRGHPWESNPWVWVVAFRRIEADQ